MSETLRRAVLIAAILNLAYFGVEFAVAVTIRSVSLFADSIDCGGQSADRSGSRVEHDEPHLLLGLGIAVMNADAARAVWATARDEHRLAGA